MPMNLPVYELRGSTLMYAVILIFSVILCLKILQIKWKNFKLRRKSLADIDTMTGHQFEEYLTVLLKTLGYHSKKTKGSGDYGVDIVLKKDDDVIAVQVKRSKNKVNLKAVQEVVGGMAYYRATKAWVITNSFYADSAKSLAQCNDVKLIDRHGLINLIEKGKTK